MRLDISRAIISTLLEIAIAISVIVFSISVIMTFTVADQNYFINQFANQELVSVCNAQLNMKYEALSSETGIPARVFERVKEDYPTDEALRQAALSLFSEENETLYSENKVNYFYELSMEYLDGNEITYKKADIKRAAEKAARIYSDTVGLHNSGGIEEKLAKFSSLYPKATILSFIVAAACFPTVIVMYKRKKEGYFCALGGVYAGAIATAIGSVLFVLFRFGSGLNILPEAYEKSILATTSRNFLIVAFLSVIISAGAFSLMRLADKKIQDED